MASQISQVMGPALIRSTAGTDPSARAASNVDVTRGIPANRTIAATVVGPISNGRRPATAGISGCAATAAEVQPSAMARAVVPARSGDVGY